MTNRSRRRSSRIVAAVALSVAVSTIQIGGAIAEESCLSGPKSVAPAGQHWFYRVESGSKRHCWYLGDRAKLASQASAPASRAVPDASATSDRGLAGASADARAEFQMPQALTETDKAVAVPFERRAAAVAPVAPDSVEPDAAASAFTAPPERSLDVTGVLRTNGAAEEAATPPALSPQPANPPAASADATPEMPLLSSAAAPTAPQDAVTTAVPSLLGLTLILLGALILLGLSVNALYRRLEAPMPWPVPAGIGHRPQGGARRTRSWRLADVLAKWNPLRRRGDGSARDPMRMDIAVDADDAIYRMRELLTRLKSEARSQDEDAVAEAYSGRR